VLAKLFVLFAIVLVALLLFILVVGFIYVGGNFGIYYFTVGLLCIIYEIFYTGSIFRFIFYFYGFTMALVAFFFPFLL
jgi:hypothetical protein